MAETPLRGRSTLTGPFAADSFRELKRHAVRGGLATRLSRTVSFLGGKVASFVRRPGKITEGGVEVVRYKNRRGDRVAGIVDANFDTSDPSLRPDVAVVIAPAILKRKEVFGLLARTVIGTDWDNYTRTAAFSPMGRGADPEAEIAPGMRAYTIKVTDVSGIPAAGIVINPSATRPHAATTD